jgi:hypothetical protein
VRRASVGGGDRDSEDSGGGGLAALWRKAVALRSFSQRLHLGKVLGDWRQATGRRRAESRKEANLEERAQSAWC